MSIWAVVAIVLGAILLLAGAAILGVFAWRGYERRKLMYLLVRTEAVEAAAGALTSLVMRLADGSDEELALFANDADSVERRTLAEVESRARILTGELDRVALPKRLVPEAEAIADAAFVVAEQASCIPEGERGMGVLDRLSCIDLELVRGYTNKARVLLRRICDECGLDDTAVYGGGLYL